MSYTKASASVEQVFYKRTITGFHSGHTTILNRMDRLTDLFLDEDLGKKAHEEKHAQLTQKKEKTS